MAYVTPGYSPSQVDSAGRTLIQPASDQEFESALKIINNWVSSHYHPLIGFRMTLSERSKKVYPGAITVQRLKRLPAIQLKLHKMPWLKLSEMQDLGGCRVILNSVRHVDELIKRYLNPPRSFRHKLIKPYDYIRNPKKTGYRGFHLVYQYHAKESSPYEGLKVEMQFRTPLQHIWATAVETAGRFRGEPFKSDLGDPEWRRFFALMGSVLALKEEETHLIPSTPHDRTELLRQAKEYEQRLNVIATLATYGHVAELIEKGTVLHGTKFFILRLDATKKETRIVGYGSEKEALEARRQGEREMLNTPTLDVLLIATEDVRKIKTAYPNYYLDTRRFVEEVRLALN